MDFTTFLTLLICGIALWKVIDVICNFYGLSTDEFAYYLYFYLFLLIMYYIAPDKSISIRQTQ